MKRHHEMSDFKQGKTNKCDIKCEIIVGSQHNSRYRFVKPENDNRYEKRCKALQEDSTAKNIKDQTKKPSTTFL